MSVPGNGSEQSMEEILASIRNLISQEGAQPGPTSAPAPVMPQPLPQQQANGPATNAAHSDEKPRSPLPGLTSGPIRVDTPSPGPAPVPAPAASPSPSPAAASAVPRQDDDDLADLLDDPLNPADLRPAIAEEPAPPAAASPVVSERKPESEVPAAPAAATGMNFDFGSLVPNRDASTHQESGAAIPGQSRTHENTFDTALTASAKPAADGPSLGWPDSMRGGPTGLSMGTAAGSAFKQADTSAGPDIRKPADQPNPGLSMKPGSSGGAEASLAPSRTEPTLSPAAGGFASTPAVDVKKAAPAPGPDSSQKMSPGLSQREAPAVSRSAETASAAVKSETDAPAAFPSIEPVLKAFERSAPGPSASGQNASQSAAPRAKIEFGSKPLSSGFGQAGTAGSGPAQAAPVPAATPTPAPAAVAKAAVSAAAGQPFTGSRTLEDAVMDLLRPMLREWLDENLPRIIEAAVQREVADTIRNKVDRV